MYYLITLCFNVPYFGTHFIPVMQNAHFYNAASSVLPYFVDSFNTTS